MAKSYKNKPFSEWTEADFQAAEADRRAMWEVLASQSEQEIKEEMAKQDAEYAARIAEREAAEKQEA